MSRYYSHTLQDYTVLGCMFLWFLNVSFLQVDNGSGTVWTFREVLDRLLGVVCGSVRQALRGERVTPLPALVHNTCLLLAATVAELSAETSTTEVGYVTDLY